MSNFAITIIAVLSIPLLIGCDPSGSTSCGDGQGVCPELPPDTQISDGDASDMNAEAETGETRILSVALDGTDVPEDGTVAVVAETTGATARTVATIRLGSAGSAPLIVEDIAVTSIPPGSLRLESKDGGVLPGVGHPATINPGDGILIDLIFTPNGAPTTATVDITSDGGAFRFYVTVSNPNPKLEVQPTSVDFGIVASGTTATESLSLINSGTATLEITKFMLSGHPNYSVVLGGREYQVSIETASEGMIIEPPISIEPGTSAVAEVHYRSFGAEEAQGRLVLFGNDPSVAQGVSIKLSANPP